MGASKLLSVIADLTAKGKSLNEQLSLAKVELAKRRKSKNSKAKYQKVKLQKVFSSGGFGAETSKVLGALHLDFDTRRFAACIKDDQIVVDPPEFYSEPLTILTSKESSVAKVIVTLDQPRPGQAQGPPRSDGEEVLAWCYGVHFSEGLV